jgi:hypothetical protein
MGNRAKSLFCRGWKTKRNGKNGKFSETKRNGTEKIDKIKKRNETKRKATGNETKRNDIV